MSEPLNPVTFRGVKYRGSQDTINVTVQRVWINSDRTVVPDGMNRLAAPEWEKKVLCMLWDGEDAHPHSLGEVVLDEDHFIRGLKKLFPHGELQDKK